MLLPAKLPIKMYAEILDIFSLWNMDSIKIDSRTSCGTYGECDINWLAFIDFDPKVLITFVWGLNYLEGI